MARKRTKKEAKERIDDLPLLPPVPPFLKPYVPVPLRVLSLLQRPAKEVAKIIVDADPLNRLADETTVTERVEAAQEAFQTLVNDPSIKMAAEELQMINDDNTQIVSNGNGMIPIQTNKFSDSIRGQFNRANLLGRLTRSPGRKKTKTDRNMSKALEEANRRLRTTKGKLRKGKTQGDIMRLAHRLRKKMK